MHCTIGAQNGAVIVRDADIVAAIDAALPRRRADYAGQPHAWYVFSEASHVATLCEQARAAFIALVANELGAFQHRGFAQRIDHGTNTKVKLTRHRLPFARGQVIAIVAQRFLEMSAKLHDEALAAVVRRRRRNVILPGGTRIGGLR